MEQQIPQLAIDEFQKLLLWGVGLLITNFIWLLITHIQNKRRNAKLTASIAEDITNAGRKYYKRLDEELEEERTARKELEQVVKIQGGLIEAKDGRISTLETQLAELQKGHDDLEQKNSQIVLELKQQIEDLKEELRMITQTREQLIVLVTEKNRYIEELEALLRQNHIEVPPRNTISEEKPENEIKIGEVK